MNTEQRQLHYFSTSSAPKFPGKGYLDWLEQGSCSCLPSGPLFPTGQAHPSSEITRGWTPWQQTPLRYTGKSSLGFKQKIQYLSHAFVSFMRVFSGFCSPFLDSFHDRSVVNSMLSMICVASLVLLQIHAILVLRKRSMLLLGELTQTELAFLSSPIFSNSHVSLSVSLFTARSRGNMYVEHI